MGKLSLYQWQVIMSSSKVGFWARIGGMLSSLFLKGKDREKAIDVSETVGGVADAINDETRRR